MMVDGGSVKIVLKGKIMYSHKIYCHICDKPMREYHFQDETHFFCCDSKWCPIDDYQIKITKSPKKQEDGTYLSVMRV